MSNNTFENTSLYIPRVFPNITQDKIKLAFEKNGIGKVMRVDLVSKVPEYNVAYIHFEYWNDTITARNFQSYSREPKGAKLVYNDPWHWIVLENKAKKYEPGARKVRINLGEPNLNFKIAPALNEEKYVDIQIQEEKEYENQEKEDQEKEDQEKEDQELMEILREMEEIDEELKNEEVSLVEARYVEMLEASNATMFNKLNAFQYENVQLHKKINDLQEEHNVGLKVLISEIHMLRQQVEYLKK